MHGGKNGKKAVGKIESRLEVLRGQLSPSKKKNVQKKRKNTTEELSTNKNNDELSGEKSNENVSIVKKQFNLKL